MFDIAVLGLGHSFSHARAGVFRLVEQTAMGLIESGECEVHLSVSQGHFLQCMEYLKVTPMFADYKMYPPHRALFLLSNLLTRAPLGLVRPYAYFAASIPLRRLLGGKVFFTTKSLTILDHIDIYHSPLHAIPEWVDYEKQKVFQTINDLIPVLYPHFYPKVRQDNSLRKALAGLTYNTNIICISQSTKNDLCNYVKTIDPNKVSVVSLAASEKFYECTDKEIKLSVRGKYGIPQDATYFLSVSTLEPRKNIDLTIKSFVRILQEENSKDLHLVLVGAKGWNYERIFSEIASAKDFQDKIILTGHVPDEDLAPLYSDALAFVYPSFYEGFGLPPLEAMQCGTPVITSDTSSLPEVVGDAGIMVNPTDADSLCQAMLTVYKNSELRNSMKNKSLDRASLFSWSRYIKDHLALYRKALLT